MKSIGKLFVCFVVVYTVGVVTNLTMMGAEVTDFKRGFMMATAMAFTAMIMYDITHKKP